MAANAEKSYSSIFDHREMIMNNLVAIPMQVQVAFDATSRRCASQFTSPNCGHRSNPSSDGRGATFLASASDLIRQQGLFSNLPWSPALIILHSGSAFHQA